VSTFSQDVNPKGDGNLQKSAAVTCGADGRGEDHRPCRLFGGTVWGEGQGGYRTGGVKSGSVKRRKKSLRKSYRFGERGGLVNVCNS